MSWNNINHLILKWTCLEPSPCAALLLLTYIQVFASLIYIHWLNNSDLSSRCAQHLFSHSNAEYLVLQSQTSKEDYCDNLDLSHNTGTTQNSNYGKDITILLWIWINWIDISHKHKYKTIFLLPGKRTFLFLLKDWRWANTSLWFVSWSSMASILGLSYFKFLLDLMFNVHNLQVQVLIVALMLLSSTMLWAILPYLMN